MLTPEQIDAARKSSVAPERYFDPTRFARAIEAAATAQLLERIEELDRLAETLKLEAQTHAQEARTANATITEIYQLCSGGTGEPGNWHGAEPVREKLAELEAKLAYRVTDTPIKLTECQFLETLSAAAPAAPEQKEPKRQYYYKVTGCPATDCEQPECICWHDEGTGPFPVTAPDYLNWRAKLVAQAPNAQQAEPPPGWKTVVVPEDVGPEPDWEDVRYQAETATGIELPRAVFSIVIREVRRWMAAQQAEAQEPFAWAAVPNAFAHPSMERFLDFDEPNQRVDWDVVPLFTRPQPAQLQALSEEEVRKAVRDEGMSYTAPDARVAKAIQSALAAKNGVNLK